MVLEPILFFNFPLQFPDRGTNRCLKCGRLPLSQRYASVPTRPPAVGSVRHCGARSVLLYFSRVKCCTGNHATHLPQPRSRISRYGRPSQGETHREDPLSVNVGSSKKVCGAADALVQGVEESRNAELFQRNFPLRRSSFQQKGVAVSNPRRQNASLNPTGFFVCRTLCVRYTRMLRLSGRNQPPEVLMRRLFEVSHRTDTSRRSLSAHEKVRRAFSAMRLRTRAAFLAAFLQWIPQRDNRHPVRCFDASRTAALGNCFCREQGFHNAKSVPPRDLV